MIDHASKWWGAIAESMEDGYIATDGLGRVIAFNQAALHILDITATQMKDPAWWNSPSSGVIGRVLQERKELQDHKIKQSNVYGKDCWLRIMGKYLYTADETGYIITFRNVTHWIEANRSLNTIISSLDDITLEVTIEGLVLHVWMHRSSRLTLPWMEMEGKMATGFMPEKLLRNLMLLMKKVMATGKELVKVFYDPLEKGQHAWYRVRMLKPGTINNTILISLRDVTPELQASQELRETRALLEDSQQIFKKVFEYSPTSIGLVSGHGIWIDVNESMIHTLGYKREEIIGMSVREMVHPDDLDMAVKQITMLNSGEINTYRAERRYLHKNGHYIWMFLAAAKMPYPDGSVKFYIVQMMDVTEMKHLVTESQKKNIILHANSVDLQQRIKQLQELNQIIAHNLRGPATALISSTELLPDMESKQDRDLLLQHMKNTASAILDTLNDLKAVLEQQSNHDLLFTDCELEPLVEQMWSLLNQQVVEKSAQLVVELQESRVFYSRPYLENILFHLINNALTYTRSEVVPVIRVVSWKEEDTTVIMVEDNGIGIDLQRHRGQLFKYKKKFHRGYNSNGVGLFMIRNQIRTFGGNIDVTSEIGKGSRFYVYFNNRVHISKEDE